MKKSYLAAAGIGLMLTMTLIALPTIAGTEQAQIAQANAQIQKISGQCVAQLKQADSASVMNAIAGNCDAGIQQILANLVAALGHTVPYTMQVVCVTNNKVGYTACFDPIHIGGSGG